MAYYCKLCGCYHYPGSKYYYAHRIYASQNINQKVVKRNQLKDGDGNMASNIHKAIAPIIDKIIKDFNECKKIKLIIINDEDSKIELIIVQII